MEVWQRAHGAACVFACVCVEGEYVAREFARLYLHTATNCVVEGPDIPQIPLQLGCSGFVVVDQEGNIVTTKTKALLDYGEVAFRDVDAKLAVLLGGDALPVGSAVELTGLSNDAFNGRRGIVAETPENVRQAGRIAVIVDGQAIALKRENLVVDAPTRSASPEGDLKKIGHAGMDAEHAAIGQALQELRETRSRDALQVARDEFREHATHEEDLMVAARFGGDPADDLSAVNSHRRDHERIVALADAVLKQGTGIIRKKDIDAFANAIVRHTENFDALYVDAANALDAPCGARGCASAAA